MAHHITQRGVDHCPVFQADSDRLTYLQLLRGSLAEADVRVWAGASMTNHVHLVILPNREDSLALVLRRHPWPLCTVLQRSKGPVRALWQNGIFPAYRSQITCGRRWHMWTLTRCALESWKPGRNTRGRAPVPIEVGRTWIACWTWNGGATKRKREGGRNCRGTKERIGSWSDVRTRGGPLGGRSLSSKWENDLGEGGCEAVRRRRRRRCRLRERWLPARGFFSANRKCLRSGCPYFTI